MSANERALPWQVRMPLQGPCSDRSRHRPTGECRDHARADRRPVPGGKQSRVPVRRPGSAAPSGRRAPCSPARRDRAGVVRGDLAATPPVLSDPGGHCLWRCRGHTAFRRLDLVQSAADSVSVFRDRPTIPNLWTCSAQIAGGGCINMFHTFGDEFKVVRDRCGRPTLCDGLTLHGINFPTAYSIVDTSPRNRGPQEAGNRRKGTVPALFGWQAGHNEDAAHWSDRRISLPVH